MIISNIFRFIFLPDKYKIKRMVIFIRFNSGFAFCLIA
jgi:hypothetical protein